MTKHMSWGANYTPRQGWFHSWLDLDLDQVRHDFEALAALGLDHVRIFPLWPLLQPNRTLIRPQAIEDVLAVADQAGEAGLRVSVDLLQGHLSSFDFLPSWVTTWHQRNLFTDPEVIDGQRALARALGRELAQRPHVSGMSLGNEFGQFAAPRHPHQCHITPEQAVTWASTLLDELQSVFPRGSHQHCFDDDLWFVDDHPFTPQSAVELGAHTTVHSWVFGGAAQRYGINAPELPLFARYLLEVAAMWHRTFSVATTRPIWLQEIGAPTPWVTPDHAADFTRESIAAAVGLDNLSAITWWCSHDVSRTLADFPELEYTLGLLDAEGNVKPAGEALVECMRAHQEGTLGHRPTSAEALTVAGLKRDGSNRSLTATSSNVFGHWMEEARAGTIRPLALVD